jgi:small multidrug resistance family-3 protein
LLLLLVSAVLEAGGDAIVRFGLRAGSLGARAGLFVAGAAVLFAYGVVVNLPGWDFGRLLGVYVVLFFIVAQVINRFAFGVPPGAPVFVGGALIVAGGLVLAFWHPG